ncbi:MAG: adenylosuccinate synthetase, partial [Actinobacteria bacterium]|nr:adenylosuccinate synthetase [Actinomycetota bacterium]
MHKCKPVYKVLEGWKEDISGVKSFEDLPLNTKKYIEAIEKLIKVPISMISVGPERSQIIMKNESFAQRFFNINKKPLLVM